MVKYGKKSLVTQKDINTIKKFLTETFEPIKIIELLTSGYLDMTTFMDKELFEIMIKSDKFYINRDYFMNCKDLDMVMTMLKYDPLICYSVARHGYTGFAGSKSRDLDMSATMFYVIEDILKLTYYDDIKDIDRKHLREACVIVAHHAEGIYYGLNGDGDSHYPTERILEAIKPYYNIVLKLYLLGKEETKKSSDLKLFIPTPYQFEYMIYVEEWLDSNLLENIADSDEDYETLTKFSDDWYNYLHSGRSNKVDKRLLKHVAKIEELEAKYLDEMKQVTENGYCPVCEEVFMTYEEEEIGDELCPLCDGRNP